MPSLKGFLRPLLGAVVFLAVATVSVATAQSSLSVMTYNVDEGTDFDAIVAVLSNPNATATDFENAVTATVGEVQDSHPEIRASLIASAIANSRMAWKITPELSPRKGNVPVAIS